MKYECGLCWKLFEPDDIIILGNGEISCCKCYVASDDEIEELKKIDFDAVMILKKKFVKGEIGKYEYTEKMARL